VGWSSWGARINVRGNDVSGALGGIAFHWSVGSVRSTRAERFAHYPDLLHVYESKTDAVVLDTVQGKKIVRRISLVPADPLDVRSETAGNLELGAFDECFALDDGTFVILGEGPLSALRIYRLHPGAMLSAPVDVRDVAWSFSHKIVKADGKRIAFANQKNEALEIDSKGQRRLGTFQSSLTFKDGDWKDCNYSDRCESLGP